MWRGKPVVVMCVILALIMSGYGQCNAEEIYPYDGWVFDLDALRGMRCICVFQFNRHMAAGAANWVIDELEKLGYIEVARWDGESTNLADYDGLLVVEAYDYSHRNKKPLQVLKPFPPGIDAVAKSLGWAPEIVPMWVKADVCVSTMYLMRIEAGPLTIGGQGSWQLGPIVYLNSYGESEFEILEFRPAGSVRLIWVTRYLTRRFIKDMQIIDPDTWR